MNPLRNTHIGALTRGGQITFHFLEMTFQILRKFASWWLLSLVAVTLSLVVYMETFDSLNVYFEYWLCRVFYLLDEDPSRPWSLKLHGETFRTTMGWMLSSPEIGGVIDGVNRSILFSSVISLGGNLLLAFAAIFWVSSIGVEQSKDKFVRGAHLVEKEELAKAVKAFAKEKKEGKLSPITIGGVPLPEGFELTSFMITGSQRSGKSLTFMEMLSRIREAGQRAVVYDSTGDYVERFYRPGVDIILNPFDSRDAGWDIWSDIQYEFDYKAIAQAYIPVAPDSKKENFFEIAAQLVFTALMKKFHREGRASIKLFSDSLVRTTQEEIIKATQGTEAAALINEEGGRTTSSIRAVLAANTSSLKYLPEKGGVSITEFIETESDRWLFVTTNARQIDALRPLITAIFQVLNNAILSLKPDRNRRIALAIDELPSLNYLSSLEKFLGEGAKFGGFGMLGYQSHSQLQTRYGDKGAATLADLCATFMSTRVTGPEGADFSSKQLFETENFETRENTSYGVSQIRDGVSINQDRQSRRLVSPTELMNLEDRVGFLRLGRGLPIAQIELAIPPPPKDPQPGFIMNPAWMYEARPSESGDAEEEDDGLLDVKARWNRGTGGEGMSIGTKAADDRESQEYKPKEVVIPDLFEGTEEQGQSESPSSGPGKNYDIGRDV